MHASQRGSQVGRFWIFIIWRLIYLYLEIHNLSIAILGR